METKLNKQLKHYFCPVVLALLWHVTWLFVFSVDVQPTLSNSKKDLKIYFVGPVLNDESFNMILASKPELSRTFYSSSQQIDQNLEPEAVEVEHKEPGDLVSVPLGKPHWNVLENIMGSNKPLLRTTFEDQFDIAIVKSPFPIMGNAAKRDLLYVPDIPYNLRMGSLNELAVEADPEFEFEVNRDGEVIRLEVVISSGDVEVDRLWRNYLQAWRFVPLKAKAERTSDLGRIVVFFSEEDDVIR